MDSSNTTENKSSWLDIGMTPREASKEIIFGSLAGMVAEVIEYPFDLAKVRLQSQLLSTPPNGIGPTFHGPLDCLNQTWKEEGFRGLYRGLSVPLAGAMAETAALFLAYSSFQNAIKSYTHGRHSSEVIENHSLTIPQLGIAAAGAGFVASFILTPIELIKCRMQVQMMNIHTPNPRRQPKSFFTSKFLLPSTNPFNTPSLTPIKSPINSSTRPFTVNSIHIAPPGSLSLVRSILHESGLKGFWLGQTGTILRETGGCAIWFVGKEVIADKLQERRLNIPTSTTTNPDLLPWESAVAGAAAGAICTLLVYPADTVKSAIQTEEELRSHSSPIARRANPSSFWQTAVKMYQSYGLKGLYTGCAMTVARSVPSSAIIFVVYDGLQQWFH